MNHPFRQGTPPALGPTRPSASAQFFETQASREFSICCELYEGSDEVLFKDTVKGRESARDETADFFLNEKEQQYVFNNLSRSAGWLRQDPALERHR